MNFHYSTLCETFGGIGNNVVNIIRKHKKCFHFVVRNYIDALSSCVYFSSNTSVEVLPSVDLQPIEDTSLNSVSTSTSANKLKKAFYFHKYPFLPRYPYFQSYILDRSVAGCILSLCFHCLISSYVVCCWLVSTHFPFTHSIRRMFRLFVFRFPVFTVICFYLHLKQFAKVIYLALFFDVS